MERRVVWMCVLVGSTVGGFAPALWGGSALGTASLALAFVGGIVGLWVGVRLASYY